MNTELKVTSNLSGLARRLVVESILDEGTADNACTESNKKNKTLLSWLIRNKTADPAALASAASDEYGIPMIDIRAFDLARHRSAWSVKRSLKNTRPCPFICGATNCSSG